MLTLIFLIIDIISKIIIDKYLLVNKSIKIINDFLCITYVKNTGAAWSIFSSESVLVIIISSLIILGIILYLYKNRPKAKMEKIAYSLIMGGALGNFVNRLVSGYVIDFIDVKIFKYDYPIFNLADCFIVVGVTMLVVYTWRCENANKGGRK